MAQQFFQIVCRLGIFMVCARLLIHFRAQESYEKYLKLLVSVMILIQLFLPLGNFLSAEKKEAGLKELEGIRQEFEAELERAQLQVQEADRMLEQMTLEELQRRVEEEREKEQAEKEKEEGTIGGEKQTKGEQEKWIGEISVEVEKIQPIGGQNTGNG